VFQVKSGEIQLSLTRWLVDNLKSDWDNVLVDVSQYHFKHGEDFVKWKFGNKGSFSVQSVCNAMTTNQNGPMFKNIWKGKNPAKIKIFMWLVHNNAILTKDNLLRRLWKVSPTCCFCDQDECMHHLLFCCANAEVIWATFAICLGANDIPASPEKCWS